MHKVSQDFKMCLYKTIMGFMPNPCGCKIRPYHRPYPRFDSNYTEDIQRIKEDPRLYGRLLDADSQAPP